MTGSCQTHCARTRESQRCAWWRVKMLVYDTHVPLRSHDPLASNSCRFSKTTIAFKEKKKTTKVHCIIMFVKFDLTRTLIKLEKTKFQWLTTKYTRFSVFRWLRTTSFSDSTPYLPIHLYFMMTVFSFELKVLFAFTTRSRFRSSVKRNYHITLA